MAKQEKMSFFDIQQRFATEQACESHLFSMKWPKGFICPKCGCTEFYTTKTRRLPLYACQECGHQPRLLWERLWKSPVPT